MELQSDPLIEPTRSDQQHNPVDMTDTREPSPRPMCYSVSTLNASPQTKKRKFEKCESNLDFEYRKFQKHASIQITGILT